VKLRCAWVTRAGSISEESEDANRGPSPNRKGGGARRLVLVCPTVLLSAGLALSVAIAGAPPAEAGPQTLGISQGSIATHPFADVSEGPSPGYSQIVDNATKGSFRAPGWREPSGGGQGAFGANYARTSQYGASARFKAKIPATGYYTVYAWWPAAEENSAATRYGISTTSGVEWTTVNQQTDGSMWVRLGAYGLEEGDTPAVKVSPDSVGGGRVVADAVMVVRGTQVNPEDAAGERMTAAGKGKDTAGKKSTAGRPTAADVVRVARRYIGTKYKYATCTDKAMSCTCLTKTVFSKFGHKLPMSEDGQWNYERGRKVAKSDLRPGDIVFFKERGQRKPITHMGIYSGNGNFIHASAYWGKVVERPMKYVDGYVGAKRLRPR
jgi:cell wall-associated NlpC family hydrolase